MHPLRTLCVAASVLACSPARPPLPAEASPGVVFPVHVAEGKGGGGPPKSPDPPPAPPRKVSRSSPPDPEPLTMARQYEVKLVWEDRRVRVDRIRAVELAKARTTERRMGRFALELWIGRELIERVRFDFPLLAAEDPAPTRRRPLHEPPSFAGAVLHTTVLVPASPRARRALILDRATGAETPLEWPPRSAVPASAR